jgi:hypothetical protein
MTTDTLQSIIAELRARSENTHDLWPLDVAHRLEAIERQRAGWVSVKDRTPDRNTTTVYWHRGDHGFYAIADEWRDEDHLAHATHWLDIAPPQAGKGTG